MKILLEIGLVGLTIGLTSTAVAQVRTLSEEVRSAEIKAQTIRSNVNARAMADAEYLRIHPVEATNALSPRQLELLDIARDPSSRSNYFSQPHAAAELLEFTNTVRFFLTNAAAQSSYFFHVHGVSESEYRSNIVYAIQHAPPPRSWPDPSKRKAIFEHCAAVLRSAIDTNQIEVACSKLKNPTEAATLRDIVRQAGTDLDSFADLLLGPGLDSFVGLGYEAKISNATNRIRYRFWSEDGPRGVIVRDLEKRTPDGMQVLFRAHFTENGRLKDLEMRSPDGKGVLTTEMQLVFDEDGALGSHWVRRAESKP